MLLNLWIVLLQNTSNYFQIKKHTKYVWGKATRTHLGFSSLAENSAAGSHLLATVHFFITEPKTMACGMFTYSYQAVTKLWNEPSLTSVVTGIVEQFILKIQKRGSGFAQVLYFHRSGGNWGNKTLVRQIASLLSVTNLRVSETTVPTTTKIIEAFY